MAGEPEPKDGTELQGGRDKRVGVKREDGEDVNYKLGTCRGGRGRRGRRREEQWLEAAVMLGHGGLCRSSWQVPWPLLGNPEHQCFLRKGEEETTVLQRLIQRLSWMGRRHESPAVDRSVRTLWSLLRSVVLNAGCVTRVRRGDALGCGEKISEFLLVLTFKILTFFESILCILNEHSRLIENMYIID